MKRRHFSLVGGAAVAMIVAMALSGGAAAEPGPIQLAQASPAAPTPQQRVAALKAWLKASQAELKHYQWIQTTVVSVDGEEKSKQEDSVYYDVTGKLQKVPVPGESESSSSGGPPGILPPGKIIKLIAKHKQEEMKKFINSAVALLHRYLPPDPSLIQQAVDAGNMGIDMVEPGREVELEFKNYLMTGDSLGAKIDLQANRLVGVDVSSYVDDPQDAFTLAVTMGVLPDGTMYMAKSVLDAPEKKLQVTLENSGYRKTES